MLFRSDDTRFEERSGDRAAVRRVILCTGKIYYDLATRRDELDRDDIAIVRVEQLYPFPADEIEGILESYPNREQVTWVQEEPRNHGAYFHMQRMMRDRLEVELEDISRVSSPSPSGGSAAMHEQEQREIVTAAIDGVPRTRASKSDTGSSKSKKPKGSKPRGSKTSTKS